MAGIIANDKHNMAVAAGIVPDQVGEIDARNRRGWHSPGSRNRPITAVHEAKRGVRQAGWLVLRERCRWSQISLNQARAVSLVVPHAIDIKVIPCGVGADFERNGAASIHADIGGKALNGRVPGGSDVPDAVWGPGETVFLFNGIGGCGATGKSGQRTAKQKSKKANQQTSKALHHPSPSPNEPQRPECQRKRAAQEMHVSSQLQLQVAAGWTFAGVCSRSEKMRIFSNMRCFNTARKVRRAM